MRTENFYDEILDDRLVYGLKHIQPENVHPCMGTIFIVLPPKQTETEGGIQLPGTMDIPSQVARVAAVPDDPKCPVLPGDWIVFRAGVYEETPFGGRTDLAVVQYTDDVDSQILAVISGADMDAAMMERDAPTHKLVSV